MYVYIFIEYLARLRLRYKQPFQAQKLQVYVYVKKFAGICIDVNFNIYTALPGAEIAATYIYVYR